MFLHVFQVIQTHGYSAFHTGNPEEGFNTPALGRSFSFDGIVLILRLDATWLKSRPFQLWDFFPICKSCGQ